jgi:hypothetical protein
LKADIHYKGKELLAHVIQGGKKYDRLMLYALCEEIPNQSLLICQEQVEKPKANRNARSPPFLAHMFLDFASS